ncbi:MAG: PPOX class F420-dependent oxidoreductase, partial [Chloroflexota bacterium]|nr:PPOX class F420-dependent oxidoreductase [Chloroflexota bacterium]
KRMAQEGDGMGAMSQAAMERFLAAARIAHLVTLRPDGSPHVAPVWYEYVDGVFLVWTSRQFRKVKNIEGDARAVVSIASEDQPYRYVVAECDVTVSGDDVWDIGMSISTRYEGAEGGGTFMEQYYDEGNSVVLRLTPRRTMTWSGEDEA